MSPLPPARRVRRAFIRAGLLISFVIFFAGGYYVLFGQWIAGHASGGFMLGTALVLVGICIGIFAVVAAIGLALSTVFPDEPYP